MLHIIRYSPWQHNLDEILLIIKKNDDLILIQDGVIGAIKGSRFIKIFTKIPITIFALKEDVNARGIANQISRKVKIVDYTYFVSLTVKNTNQISW